MRIILGKNTLCYTQWNILLAMYAFANTLQKYSESTRNGRIAKRIIMVRKYKHCSNTYSGPPETIIIIIIRMWTRRRAGLLTRKTLYSEPTFTYPNHYTSYSMSTYAHGVSVRRTAEKDDMRQRRKKTISELRNVFFRVLLYMFMHTFARAH